MVRRSNAAEHEQLRRVYGTAGKDHAVFCVDLLATERVDVVRCWNLSAPDVLDADRLLAGE